MSGITHTTQQVEVLKAELSTQNIELDEALSPEHSAQKPKGRGGWMQKCATLEAHYCNEKWDLCTSLCEKTALELSIQEEAHPQD